MDTHWQEPLEIDADQVLRGQGADPQTIRGRSPRLVEVAERALEDGSHLIHPQVHQRRLEVGEFTHQRVKLENGTTLSGPLLGQHLGPATQVVAVLCTIGPDLERYASEVMTNDIVAGLALDGLGSAAVESLANAVCHRIELEAKGESLEATIPLSPGMDGWPVEKGQSQIFSLWQGEDIGIVLTPSWVMTPRKSLSMIVGLGEHVLRQGTTCDYCTMRETCRYQDHYSSAQ